MTKDQREEILIRKRIIPIIGRIENNFVSDVQKMLFQISFENPKEPVHFVIDSGGGNVIPALNIYDLIKGMPFDSVATVIGACNSAALIILSACSKRRATITSRFLFHAMRTEGLIISTEDIERQVFEISRKQRIVFEQGLSVQSKAFGISEKDLKEMMTEGEKYDIKLTAEEAKQKGVIHEIVEKFDFLSFVA
jgi:ATP-dependent protease ClpP protease subunit